nr:MAG TPA: Cytokine-like protein 1 [Crassvirales sp.]
MYLVDKIKSPTCYSRALRVNDSINLLLYGGCLH